MKSISTELDQYYTDPEYAKSFYQTINSLVNIGEYDIVLEPSAGTGSFYNLFPVDRRVGLDLDPKSPGIIKHDFLTWQPESCSVKVIAIGNPPFGKNANLAVKFFNHCAEFCDTIAFVIPKTFRKSSLINRLSENFVLIHDEDVPDNSFIFDDAPYDVWCCAQVWQRSATKRAKIKSHNIKELANYLTVTSKATADICVQRVGANAGIVRTSDFQSYSTSSHYFFKCHRPETVTILKSIDFAKVKFNTAGNPSIGLSELTELFLACCKNTTN